MADEEVDLAEVHKEALAVMMRIMASQWKLKELLGSLQSGYASREEQEEACLLLIQASEFMVQLPQEAGAMLMAVAVDLYTKLKDELKKGMH